MRPASHFRRKARSGYCFFFFALVVVAASVGFLKPALPRSTKFRPWLTRDRLPVQRPAASCGPGVIQSDRFCGEGLRLPRTAANIRSSLL